MISDIHDFFRIGLGAILCGGLVLAMLVHRELGPRLGLDPAGRWLLAGGLDMGLLAFAFKLGVALNRPGFRRGSVV